MARAFCAVMRRAAIGLVLFVPCARVPAAERVLLSFETEAELAAWEAVKGPALRKVPDHATHGAHALLVETGSYLSTWRLPGDWSGYESFVFDAYNGTGAVVSVYLLVADKAWQAEGKSTYWNRHNGSLNLLPGDNTVSVSVSGLYRGEAGSRNNDIARDIDPGAIVRVDLGFGGKPGPVYLDGFRLTRTSRPEFVHAFDFGPESQAIWPGFIPVSWNTTYTKDRGYGLSREQADANRSRDDTFPTRLFQDWTAMERGEFKVDLPDGLYRVWAVFNDCGYWGGEYARHTVRSILAEGEEVIKEDRWKRGGSWEPLYLFQNVEPVPGRDIAGLYFDPLFRPRETRIRIKDGQLNLKIRADAPFSAKLAALVIHPAHDAKARRWVTELWEANRREFLTRAAPLEDVTPSPGRQRPARGKDHELFFPSTDERVGFDYTPDAGRRVADLRVKAAPGETAVVTFGILPRKDVGSVRVSARTLKGESGTIAASRVRVRVVRHLIKRGYNTLRWRLEPWYLADPGRTNLKKGLSRQFWATVAIPKNARPGTYAGEIGVTSSAGLKEKVRFSLEVLPIQLEDPDIPVALYGMRSEWLEFLRGYGMTGLSGGPNITFKGFDTEGEPELDYGAVDEYMALAKELGYRGPVLSYHGPACLDGVGYEGVEERFAEWGRPAGLSALEAARRILREVETRANDKDWLPFIYPMCDEPRVRETTARILDSVRFLKRASGWVRIGGSYSVDFSQRDDPLLLKELFRQLDVSILNTHGEAVMKEARKLGKDIYIYNQGRDRYTFGAYLFAERSRGVKGFCQWHAYAVHGYQYFDLDGREPDDTMLMLTTSGISPTLDLERVRQGIWDLRYLMTLDRLAAEAKEAGKDAASAERLLERVTSGIDLDEKKKPDWLDLGRLREQVVKEILGLLEQS